MQLFLRREGTKIKAGRDGGKIIHERKPGNRASNMAASYIYPEKGLAGHRVGRRVGHPRFGKGCAGFLLSRRSFADSLVTYEPAKLGADATRKTEEWAHASIVDS